MIYLTFSLLLHFIDKIHSFGRQSWSVKPENSCMGGISASTNELAGKSFNDNTSNVDRRWPA